MTPKAPVVSNRPYLPPAHGPVNATKGQKLTIKQKFGIAAVCYLSIGLALILAALGFLWFLWSADSNNAVWRSITRRGWVNRSVVLTALVIRQSVSFQSAVATAMLACVAIERAVVMMLHLAAVSLARDTNSGPLFLAWWIWKAFIFHTRRWRHVFIPAIVTTLLCTSILIQLTSFALISDVGLAIVEAATSTMSTPTTFEYNNGTVPVITHGSTWGQQPQSYVAFAEYHEDVHDKVIDGVDDTGMTLRAFLPVADQQSRSMVASWSGRANVLDSRVVCVRPKLEYPHLHFASSTLALESSFTPDIADQAAINLIPADTLTSYHDSRFACIMPLQNSTETRTQWRMTICQPAASNSMLQSALEAPGQTTRQSGGTSRYTPGTVYVVLNVSSGTRSEWNQAVPTEDPELGLLVGNGTSPIGFSVHGAHNEWYDLIFSEDAKLNLSVTVCYTAFDTADLHVDMQAASNHSDLTPRWDAETRSFNYTEIRSQLGQSLESGAAAYSNSTKQLIARRVMALSARQSWTAQADYGDYVPGYITTVVSWIVDYANMFGSSLSQVDGISTSGTDFTRIMWQADQTRDMWKGSVTYDYADPFIVDLTQEILKTGGTIAFAMQSIVTVLTQTAYYQQIHQLNGISNVTATGYVLVSAPTRVRGLVAVTIVVAIHIICTFGIILPCFWWGTTQLSTLGNSWQVVGQLLQKETMKLLSVAALAPDSEAKRVIKFPSGKKGKLKNHQVIGLRISPDGLGVEIFSSGRANAADVPGVEMTEQRRTARGLLRQDEDPDGSSVGPERLHEERSSLLQRHEHPQDAETTDSTTRLVPPLFHRPLPQR